MKCKDCDCELEYSDIVFDGDDIKFENTYYCPNCKEFKDFYKED